MRTFIPDKIAKQRGRGRRRSRSLSAGTLASTLIAMSLLGIMTSAALTTITSALFGIRLSQENDRATQILLEKTESIRLYNWDQVSSNGFIPSTFTASYDPSGGTNQGITYSGTLTIAPATIGASYTNDLLSVTVRLNWTTGGLARQRELTTFVSRYGLETYIY